MLNILIIDDHPMMVEAYKNTLESSFSKKMDVKFDVGFNCEQAFRIIVRNILKYDIAIIDVMLPSYIEKKLNSGLDVITLIRDVNPACKIMILTSHYEIFVLSNLVDEIEPDALLVKSDFSPEDFLTAFNATLNGEMFYSHTIHLALKKIKMIKSDLDIINRQIILLLSKGVLTKNIPNFINISLSSVDKRKAYIKTFLDIESGTDEDIIIKARKLGFI